MSNLWGTVTFKTLVTNYITLQKKVLSAVRNIASKTSQATPGKFLLLQFQMAQVTQIGESISNMVSQIMAVINNSIRNQKSS